MYSKIWSCFPHSFSEQFKFHIHFVETKTIYNFVETEIDFILVPIGRKKMRVVFSSTIFYHIWQPQISKRDRETISKRFQSVFEYHLLSFSKVSYLMLKRDSERGLYIGSSFYSDVVLLTSGHELWTSRIHDVRWISVSWWERFLHHLNNMGSYPTFYPIHCPTYRYTIFFFPLCSWHCIWQLLCNCWFRSHIISLSMGCREPMLHNRMFIFRETHNSCYGRKQNKHSVNWLRYGIEVHHFAFRGWFADDWVSRDSHFNIGIDSTCMDANAFFLLVVKKRRLISKSSSTYDAMDPTFIKSLAHGT